MNLIIRNARVRGQEHLVDIAIDRDRIASVGPARSGKGQQEIDAGGSLVLPGLVNLHLHADKSLLGEVMRPNISGTLPEAIEITNDFKRAYDPKEVAGRAPKVNEATPRPERGGYRGGGFRGRGGGDGRGRFSAENHRESARKPREPRW